MMSNILSWLGKQGKWYVLVVLVFLVGALWLFRVDVPGLLDKYLLSYP